MGSTRGHCLYVVYGVKNDKDNNESELLKSYRTIIAMATFKRMVAAAQDIALQMLYLLLFCKLSYRYAVFFKL